MKRAGHAHQRDLSIRFILHTDSEHVLLSIYNVCFLMNETLNAQNSFYNARPNALVSGNEAVTAISGSESSPSFATKKRHP